MHVKISLSPHEIFVRMGEHDSESTDEPHPHIDRRIQRIVVHPQWNDEISDSSFIRFKYDIALLKLDAPVDYALHVIPICLPEDDNKLIGKIAFAKGYGAQEQGKIIMLL